MAVYDENQANMNQSSPMKRIQGVMDDIDSNDTDFYKN